MTATRLQAALREYVLLDAERTLVANGSRRDHLYGAARNAWLKRTRVRLDELRWQLIAIAIIEVAKRDRR